MSLHNIPEHLKSQSEKEEPRSPQYDLLAVIKEESQAGLVYLGPRNQAKLRRMTETPAELLTDLRRYPESVHIVETLLKNRSGKQVSQRRTEMQRHYVLARAIEQRCSPYGLKFPKLTRLREDHTELMTLEEIYRRTKSRAEDERQEKGRYSLSIGDEQKADEAVARLEATEKELARNARNATIPSLALRSLYLKNGRQRGSL